MMWFSKHFSWLLQTQWSNHVMGGRDRKPQEDCLRKSEVVKRQNQGPCSVPLWKLVSSASRTSSHVPCPNCILAQFYNFNRCQGFTTMPMCFKIHNFRNSHISRISFLIVGSKHLSKEFGLWELLLFFKTNPFRGKTILSICLSIYLSISVSTNITTNTSSE